MSDNTNNPENQDLQDQIRIFKATNKTSEKAPDYWGAFNIGETEYKVALWNSTSKTGTQYLNGKVELNNDVKAQETIEFIKS
tara:strand:- start:476 stop:721 length:246 start_codon:yes stop_codon:yes gene_type:complete